MLKSEEKATLLAFVLGINRSESGDESFCFEVSDSYEYFLCVVCGTGMTTIVGDLWEPRTHLTTPKSAGEED